jgi:ABC-type glycerol-3-phosphate transport system substrate-binding protein
MKKYYSIMVVFFCTLFFLTPLAGAAGKEVIIVTSFPKELFETYKKAFEEKHPGVKAVVQQKPTTQGVTYIRETASKPEADIMWASAVDAFLVLKNDKLLAKYALPKQIAAAIPAKVGTYPIHDPDGFYFGFALSGYGMMWNKPYLQAHKLKPPAEWTDRSQLFRPPRHFRPFEKRNHSSDRRGNSSGLRLGEGLGPAAQHGGKHGGHHRAELRGP